MPTQKRKNNTRNIIDPQYALQQLQTLDSHYFQLEQQENRLRKALEQLQQDEDCLQQQIVKPSNKPNTKEKEHQRQAEERLAQALFASLHDGDDTSSSSDSSNDAIAKIV